MSVLVRPFVVSVAGEGRRRAARGWRRGAGGILATLATETTFVKVTFLRFFLSDAFSFPSCAVLVCLQVFGLRGSVHPSSLRLTAVLLCVILSNRLCFSVLLHFLHLVNTASCPFLCRLHGRWNSGRGLGLSGWGRWWGDNRGWGVCFCCSPCDWHRGGCSR